jgi:hypothetical protein
MMLDINSNVIGITVCWNSRDLIEKSIFSIRKFHPDMKIIIVDGSDKSNECYSYVSALENLNTQVWHTEYNIGHGRGMNQAIRKVTLPYVLFFDSDIIMVKSPIQGMLDMMEPNTFGVGYTERVGYDGFDYGVHPYHQKQNPVKYLHPYFQLVQVSEYKKYKPYIHHGAPCISTMLDIHRRGLSDIVIKEFPGLGHTAGNGLSWKPCAGEYILHDVAAFGGTGRMRRAMGLPHIDGPWESVR